MRILDHYDRLAWYWWKFPDKQRKLVTILRFHFPHSLRLFSFSNPKFHVRLSNTLLYDYLSVARVADSNVLIRFVIAQQHSKVSVRSSFWTIISVAGVVVDVTGDQTRIQDRWKTNCNKTNKTSSLHYTTRFWSESDMQSEISHARSESLWSACLALVTISGKHWKRVTAKILPCTLKNTSGWCTVLRLPHSLRLFSFVFFLRTRSFMSNCQTHFSTTIGKWQGLLATAF